MAPCVSDAAALDAAVDMRDPQPTVVQALVGQGLFQGEVGPRRVLGRHADRDLGQREGPTAQVLQQPVPRGQGREPRMGKGLVMGTRREAGAVAGPGTTGAASSSSDVITVAASASETPGRVPEPCG